MPSDAIAFALHTPGHLRFPSTRTLAESFDKIGARVETRPNGHHVFYRPDGRRFLETDPAGHPLHECDWDSTDPGTVLLRRARVRLDWGRWVGIKPDGLVNEIRLNLASRSDWQRITPDDLRALAAGALRVPIEEVRWFYRDEDFAIDSKGLATIRQRKDALYVLDGGGFETARFMACMGAMHWDQIDFLPVVELFKSLLPGTGSAVFELIRGLYDDQNKGRSAPRPLRYRGIPTYPSEAAFRLFSGVFTPQPVGAEDPLTAFMNPSKSHRIEWLPVPHPPVRYLEESQGLCVTVKNGIVQKATLAEDPVGLPYVSSIGRRVLPLDRSLRVEGRSLILKDRERELTVPLPSDLPVRTSPPDECPISPVDWRRVFAPNVPRVAPVEAFEAVPLFPEDDQEIGELAAQSFVADYLDDLGEQDREIGRLRSRAERVLIANGDAVIATCILFDRPRDYTVHVHHVAYAQRQAQQLWTQCAEVQRWDWLQRIRMVAVDRSEKSPESRELYDLIYQWLPYGSFDSSTTMSAIIARLSHMLRRGGEAFVVGPVRLGELLRQEPSRLLVHWDESVASLPTFLMHKTILPKARVKTGLTLFHVRRL
ncbi:hypothetical protein [Candidatus Nitrospira nitrificans]|uniref:Uncharacterized protein n=1 Tax=Candidatus Nitrospira nitrificans TaxID=1742973 RepID=A0A0S4LDQ8_9BACT|nr:hypothetical protein [Candidatus Nitrospira nitrificans]CUS33250.1 conserved hypothetical protein [Candidatus Nitrospira nitrificans]